MDRKYIQDHRVVERYLHGKLTPAEEEAFEEYYLTNPDVVDELELTERLEQGLKDVAANDLLSNDAEHRRPQWWGFAASPFYAAAASLLLGVSLVLSATLYRDAAELRQELRMMAGIERPRLVPIVSVRGTDVNVVPQPEETEWVVLLLDPGLDYDSYRAVVFRRAAADVEEIWALTGLTPGYDEMLAVGLPGRLLTPGDYDVLLEGRAPDRPAFEEISRPSFRVTPTAGP